MNCRFGLVFYLLFFTSVLSWSQSTAKFNISDLKSVTKQQSVEYFGQLELETKLTDLRQLAYKRGFIGFSIDSVQKVDSLNSVVHGSLGPKYKSIRLFFSDSSQLAMRNVGINVVRSRNSVVPTSPEAIGSYLSSVVKAFETQGFPFIRLQFDSLSVTDGNLSVVLNVQPGPTVYWSRVEIVSAKDKFSERFIEAYFHIQKGALFNQEDLDQLPTRMRQLSFLKETKPSELLFTDEGAVLFLYLASKPVSSFSGTVGLQQDPVKLTTQFTGDIRLKLLNSFKRGELFELSWRSIQAGSPQLKMNASIPFLFKTPFGIDGNFNLFKRDSSFLELKGSFGVNYYLSSGNQLKAFYQRNSSNVLSGSSSLLNYGSATSNQYGLSVQHLEVDYIPNPRKGSIWSVTAAAGSRTLTKDSITTESLIYSTSAKADLFVPLGKRFVFKLTGTAESFFTDNIQQNELLRFGGNNIQRGFLEDELLATSRITGTAEFRLILDQNSNLFVFFDQSWYERNVGSYVNDTPYGFGTGLSFGTNLGIFSISVALGKQFSNPVLLRDSKVHVGYVAYF